MSEDEMSQHLVDGLRDLYQINPAAQRLFDNFGKRKQDRRETKASVASYVAEASHNQVVELFKVLDDLGAGRFIRGRHGWPSRMAWNFGIRAIGTVAAGGEVPLKTAIEENEEAEEEEDRELDGTEFGTTWEDDDLLEHQFKLRPGMRRITLRLPSNLTEREAERLAAFIQSLPFESDSA